ncbi:MAG TPA: hypothetical protein VFP32_02965 [Candidatus Saccharimonadales bacterium]|nr:hypothetical protein [Candidatus Saccharimonadales bacterium]
MNKGIDLKTIQLKPLLNKLSKRMSKHAFFIAILVVLLAYLVVVFQISGLAKAEPSPDQIGGIQTTIPKIDPTAVNQIQSLEDNNKDIQSLFEQARNNPFQE